MLQHIPAWLGHALQGVRAGADKLVIVQAGLGPDFHAIDLASPAFANGAQLPVRFTADGEGVSPPLVWGEVPPGTRSIALIVEDPDAPMPAPIVHAVVWAIDPETRRLAEGTIADRPEGGEVGRNSYRQLGWLPPDPPTGHGPHNYAFQLFALATAPDLGASPGRSALADALAGNVLAAGLLTGTYERAPEADRLTGNLAPV